MKVRRRQSLDWHLRKSAHLRPGNSAPVELLDVLEFEFTARPLPGAGMVWVLLLGSSTLSMRCTTELQMVVLFRMLAVLLGYCPATCTCNKRGLHQLPDTVNVASNGWCDE